MARRQVPLYPTTLAVLTEATDFINANPYILAAYNKEHGYPEHALLTKVRVGLDAIAEWAVATPQLLRGNLDELDS